MAAFGWRPRRLNRRRRRGIERNIQDKTTQSDGLLVALINNSHTVSQLMCSYHVAYSFTYYKALGGYNS